MASRVACEGEGKLQGPSREISLWLRQFLDRSEEASLRQPPTTPHHAPHQKDEGIGERENMKT